VQVDVQGAAVAGLRATGPPSSATAPGVLKMMELAGDWAADAVAEARRSCPARDGEPRPWQECRHRYAETLLAYAEMSAVTA
jgi:hypothetical protein